MRIYVDHLMRTFREINFMKDAFNIGQEQMIFDNSQKECTECNKLKSNHELVTVIVQYIFIRCWLKINNVNTPTRRKSISFKVRDALTAERVKKDIDLYFNM